MSIVEFNAGVNPTTPGGVLENSLKSHFARHQP